MSMLHTITTDVLNPVVPAKVVGKIGPKHPAFPQPSHVCVGTDGSYFCRDTISQLMEFGFKPAPHATVRVRPGETLDDAAWRHTQAEQRYFATL